jgi:cobalt-zinc-cadmium efflux system membrane fusion protein
MKHSYIILLCIACVVGFSSCQKSVAEEQETKETFVLSDEMLHRIKIDTAQDKPVTSQLRLSGKVTADEGKVVKVFPLLSGYAEDVRVQLGDYVQKGQVLAVVHSGEIADYEKQLSDARSDMVVAEKRLKVQQDLYTSKLATERDVVDAKGEVQKAGAEINRVNDLFNIYKKGKGSTYIIAAPISGYVIEKNINNNMEIRNDNNQNIFTISELNDVWVIANVFETDIAKVKEGFEADVVTISYPDQPYHGKIDKIYNFLDPATKTMQVRIRISNQDNQLKPEMFATVYINYGEASTSKVAVPSSSLIFDQSKQFVLVFKDKYNIEVREVDPYKTSGNITFLNSGIKPGEKVISQNQLLIYNALTN